MGDYIMVIVATARNHKAITPPTYLLSYDHEAHPRGTFAFTQDRSEALGFPTMQDGLRAYRSRSRKYPNRLDDGEPNRPLTAFTVSIEPR